MDLNFSVCEFLLPLSNNVQVLEIAALVQNIGLINIGKSTWILDVICILTLGLLLVTQ